MRIRIVAKSLALAPLRFEMMVWIPRRNARARLSREATRHGGVELATTIDSDIPVAPGEAMTLEFDWPLPDFKPTQCVFKATPETSLKFQLLVFEADGAPLIQGSGEPCGAGERMFA